MTYIERKFQQDRRYLLESRVRMLYNLFMSLSEPARCEIDGMMQVIEEKRFRNMGFISNFELAMKLMMFKADHRLAMSVFGEIERIAKGGNG